MLHVLAPARFGGLERVVQALATGQARRGHDVHVVAVLDLGGEAHPLIGALRDGGVTVHPLELPARAYRRERAAISALCLKVNPGVIHTHGYRPDILDASVGQRAGAAAVTTVHGFTGGGWRNRCYEWLQVRAYRRFDAVVAVSAPLVERLTRAGVPRERLHLIRNAWGGEGGSDQATLPPAVARGKLGLPPGGAVIGWVGRLSAEKGPDVMIEALAHLSDRGVHLAVVGDGPLGSELRRRALTAGVADRITWHGLVPDAGALYRAFDVLVLSSRTEGTPIVLLEAMAAEVPIVATAVGGVPDVISMTEGMLVPPEDPQALAVAIRGVFGDPAAATRRAAAARARLERDFALEPWLDRYDALYRAVTSSRRRT